MNQNKSKWECPQAQAQAQARTQTCLYTESSHFHGEPSSNKI